MPKVITKRVEVHVYRETEGGLRVFAFEKVA